jgi:hypothetical protein
MQTITVAAPRVNHRLLAGFIAAVLLAVLVIVGAMQLAGSGSGPRVVPTGSRAEKCFVLRPC